MPRKKGVSSERMVRTPKNGRKNHAAWLPTRSERVSQLSTTSAPLFRLKPVFCCRPRVCLHKAVIPLTTIKSTLKPRNSG